MMFWFIAIGLSVLASAFIAIPLVWSRERSAPDRESAIIGIYRERLLELDDARDEGLLSPDDYEALRVELEDSLLAETSSIASPVKSDRGQGIKDHTRWILVLALLVPMIAIGLYGDVGLSLGAISDHNLAIALRETDPSDATQMRRNAERLQEQMYRQPDNHQGWYLLAGYLMNANQPEQAAQALAHLVAAYPQDVDMAARYAEAVFTADERRLTGRVQSAIANVQKLEPMHTGMFELLGMGGASEGDYTKALQNFEQALGTLTAEERASDRARILKAAIVRIRELAGTTSDDSALLADDRRIMVKVTLAEQLDVAPGTPLFVYARAADGPAMPLAVQRLQAGDIPLTVELTEAMAMMPGMSLARFDQVVVVARLSTTGIANASPEDLEARSPVLDMTEGTIDTELEIALRRNQQAFE